MESNRIDRLARLSRLELSEAERERATSQLDNLLAHFDALQSVDTEGVDPSPYPRPITMRTRTDETGQVLPQSDVLANAPDPRSGQFRVPKVIDG